jgi:glycosyltransferase involved in cell wall biosynthesis
VKDKICVAIVAKNEEENVEYMIKGIRNAGFHNIFLVDELSVDKTVQIAKSLGVPVFQRNGIGFGVGIISALKIAHDKGYKYMVRIDCDGSYPPEEIVNLVRYIPYYDVISGRRDIKKVRLLHRLPNLFFTAFTNSLYNGKLHDINSGLKILRVESFVGILDAQGFDLEAQISIKSLKRKYKIKEVPIGFKDRYGGKSKIKISDGFLILRRIIKERFEKD